ncbi:cobalamin binding intrinsic factor-like [Pristis pectinata]|uniref:cobalamin binding intrinsic factor-like n=1 Tax=Pristis pectinata TaxID=685728 RepID=UPI00223E1012|nr:cobalamin binding intrinsic factor-like [Pristis pectinata]
MKKAWVTGRKLRHTPQHLGFETRSFHLAMYILRIIIFLLLSAFGHCAQECSVSTSEQPSVNSLLQVLQRSAEDDSVDPDPATFLALRLTHQHNLEVLRHFQEVLKAAAVRRVTQEEDLPIGSTALYTLAFRSACLNPASISDGQEQIDLVKLLEDELNLEIQSLGSKGQPLTDFYQISLAVLALCTEKQPIPTFVVKNIFDRVMNNRDPFGEPFFVDAASMSVLALTCLHRTQLSASLRLNIERAIVRLLSLLLTKQQQDSTIGSIYSTGLAVQALAEHNHLGFLAFRCANNLQLLISEIPKGTFNTVRRVFPVILALKGVSLLHVRNITCTSDQDNLTQDENGK